MIARVRRLRSFFFLFDWSFRRARRRCRRFVRCERLLHSRNAREVVKLSFLIRPEVITNLDDLFARNVHRQLPDKLRCVTDRLAKLRFQRFNQRMIGGVGRLRTFFFLLNRWFGCARSGWLSGQRLFHGGDTWFRLLDHRGLFGVCAGKFSCWWNRGRWGRPGRIGWRPVRPHRFFGTRLLRVFWHRLPSARLYLHFD